MQETLIRRRRRRFQRDPDFRPENSRAGRLKIGSRDLDIITAIAKNRFLDTDQVCKIFACDCPREFIGNKKSRPARVIEHRPNCSCTCGVEGKSTDHAKGCPALFKDDQHVARRLRELFQAGFLERPVAQVHLHVRDGELSGSVPLVYSVSREGLSIIGKERREQLGDSKLSWIGKPHKGSSRLFLEHTLRVADVSVGLDVALRNSTRFVRLSDGELKSGMSEARRKSVRPFSVAGKYQNKKLSAVCDLAFALGDREQGRRRNVLVEVDLGHMPIDRKGLTQTSIMRKIIAYATAFDDKKLEKEFGWNNVSVMVLTTSEARVKSCVAAVGAFFGSASIARIFLFGTLDASRDPLHYNFVDGRGRTVRLID